MGIMNIVGYFGSVITPSCSMMNCHPLPRLYLVVVVLWCRGIVVLWEE